MEMSSVVMIFATAMVARHLKGVINLSSINRELIMVTQLGHGSMLVRVEER